MSQHWPSSSALANSLTVANPDILGCRHAQSTDSELRLDALEADYIALSEALVQDFDLSFDNYARRDEAQACQQYMKLEAVMARVARGDEVAQARRALARMRAASVPAR